MSVGKEREITVISSGRNFFPKGAFFFSTRHQQELAESVGYRGLEILPTWRVCWEAIRYGRLLADEEFISSLHRDWRLDRVMEARLKGKPDWWFQIREKADWLFSPSDMALKVLQKLQRRYNVPVSVSWFTDTKNFSPVMLELWHKDQGIDQEGLLNWLKEDPINHGVVIDTAKISGWVESNGLTKRKEEVLRKLLPYAFEIHYRVKGKIKRALSLGGELSGDTTENLVWCLANGYKGRIVVEYGWPDLDKSPFGVFREDWFAFKKLHSKIISFIKSI